MAIIWQTIEAQFSSKTSKPRILYSVSIKSNTVFTSNLICRSLYQTIREVCHWLRKNACGPNDDFGIFDNQFPCSNKRVKNAFALWNTVYYGKALCLWKNRVRQAMGSYFSIYHCVLSPERLSFSLLQRRVGLYIFLKKRQKLTQALQ